MALITCIHSDAQVSRGKKWGFKSERDSTLEAARSLLYIEMGECRAGEIFVGTWVKRRYSSFELVSVAPCTSPIAGKGCVASKLPNVAFGLDLLLGLSSCA